MIDHDEILPITTYYIKHKDELDELFSNMTQLSRQMIINDKGETTSKGNNIVSILKTIFECNYFREVRQCEQGVLNTCEFDNHLNDYVDLTFEKTIQWTQIYYADYKTDVMVLPHKPYLCCVCDGKSVKTFTETNMTTKFLNSLQTNSLTYFHNLTYDACFFNSEPGWEVQITQRSGTLLQDVMDQYKMNKEKSKNQAFNISQ